MRTICFLAVLIGVGLLPAVAAPPAGHSSNNAATQRVGAHSGKICGWFINPTPQNMWLDSASAEWTIGIQGGFQAKGNWAWPKFPPKQWVQTNSGGYGYGCVCLRGVLDEATRHVVRVYSVKAHSLQMCRQDPALRAKEPPNPAA